MTMSSSNSGTSIGSPPGTQPGHLVVTVHGIRTYGKWQLDLESLLKEAQPGIRVLNFQFGYFSSIAFLIPFLRWVVARRFRKFLVHEVRKMPPGSRIDLVAHSFGTYLAANALGSIPEGRKVHTVLFAGSVLRPSFPWYKYLYAGRVGRVINDCGWDDTVLLLSQFAALMMGMAGRIGFQGMVGGDFKNRFFRGGHGLYFDRAHEFLRQRWLPILTTEDPVADVDERPIPTAWGGFKLFMMNNMSFIKVAGAALLVLAVVWIPIDWSSKADFKRKVERFAHIAKLNNAAQIPRRNPDHIRELLRIDAKAHEGSDVGERSIEQMLGADEPDDSDEDPDAHEPAWWDTLPILGDASADAYMARGRHARANQQLAAGRQGHPRDPSKAKILFEEAIKHYGRINAVDPTYGSYALCLIDYGLLLTELGLLDKAVAQFSQVRTDIFPVDKAGKRPGMPLSVAVDSLCYEAEALKQGQKWDLADQRQQEAKQLAGTDERLLAHVCNEIAWLKMERLDVAEATKYFQQAKAACETLVEDKGLFIYKTLLYRVRHGLAMAERLQGRRDESYSQYDQIVDELKGLMQNDLLFSPKERRDLRERLVNSMERRADVRFFARTSPSTLFAEPDLASRQTMADHYRTELAKVVKDYQSAIESVAPDDPVTPIPLFYKKVMARFLGGLADEAPSAAPLAIATIRTSAEPPRTVASHTSSGVEMIDLEFAEAERAYHALTAEIRRPLKIYREFAAQCVKLHHARKPNATATDGRLTGRFDSQAVGELRALTIDYAKKSEDLRRESVEMLLVALEILLEPGVETDDRKAALDASRMVGVLGATTKVASHEELQSYVERFHKIAVAKLIAHTPSAAQTVTGVAPASPATEPPPNPTSTVLFHLRLSPTRSLTITEYSRNPANALIGLNQP